MGDRIVREIDDPERSRAKAGSQNANLRRIDAILLSARSNEPQRTLRVQQRLRIVIARTLPITQYNAATLWDKKSLAGSAPWPGTVNI